jgi:hypothetical protein
MKVGEIIVGNYYAALRSGRPKGSDLCRKVRVDHIQRTSGAAQIRVTEVGGVQYGTLECLRTEGGHLSYVINPLQVVKPWGEYERELADRREARKLAEAQAQRAREEQSEREKQTSATVARLFEIAGLDPGPTRETVRHGLFLAPEEVMALVAGIEAAVANSVEAAVANSVEAAVANSVIDLLDL